MQSAGKEKREGTCDHAMTSTHSETVEAGSDHDTTHATDKHASCEKITAHRCANHE
jgi:hypothetical protein